MPPTPPRIINSFRILLITALFLFGMPLILFFPYLAYLGIFHTDRLVPYIIGYYQYLLDNIGFRIWGGAMVAFGVWGVIATYRKQRRKWREYQGRLSAGESATLVHLDDPVELPPPDELSLPQVVVESHKSLRTRFAQAAFLAWGMFYAYIAWSSLYFRWPPNEHLNYSILGTVGILFLVGIVPIWRKKAERIVADGVGISIHKRNHERMIFWSDVRQIVLEPITKQNKQPHLAENYHIITNGQPLDLSVPVATSPLMEFLALFQGKQDNIRLLITLAMQKTGLPLLADQNAWQEHTILIAKRDDKSNQTQNYIVILVIGIILLGLAGFVGFTLNLNPRYHTVTGQLAHYTVELDTAGNNYAMIQIQGDPTSYVLTIDGVYPYPPVSLPNGVYITMQVNGKSIDSLDVGTATTHWHIVTQSYAEPWFTWLELIAFGSMFAIPGGFLLISAAGYFLQKRRQPAGALERANVSPIEEQPPEPMKTKRELRRYARQQGKWWGVEPKEIRDIGFAVLALSICCIFSAMPFTILLAQSSILVSIVAGGVLGAVGVLSLVISIQMLKRWRVLRQINAQESTEIVGTILNWSSYMSLLSNGFDTIVQLQADDGQEYIFRIQQKYMFIARHIGGRLRIVFNPETRYVSRVALEPGESPWQA